MIKDLLLPERVNYKRVMIPSENVTFYESSGGYCRWDEVKHEYHAKTYKNLVNQVLLNRNYDV